MFDGQPTWEEEQARAKELFEAKYKIPFSELLIKADERGTPVYGFYGYEYIRGEGEHNKYYYDPVQQTWMDHTIVGSEKAADNYNDKYKATFGPKYFDTSSPYHNYTDDIRHKYYVSEYFVKNDERYIRNKNSPRLARYNLQGWNLDRVWKYIPVEDPQKRSRPTTHSLGSQTTAAPQQTTQ